MEDVKKDIKEVTRAGGAAGQMAGGEIEHDWTVSGMDRCIRDLRAQHAFEQARRLNVEGVLRSCIFEGLSSGGDLIPSEELKASLQRGQKLVTRGEKQPDETIALRAEIEELKAKLAEHEDEQGDTVKCEGCSKAVPVEDSIADHGEDNVYLCAHCALGCADAAYGELVEKVEGVVGAVGAISKFPEDAAPLVRLLFLPESHEAALAMFDVARVSFKVRRLEDGALDCVGCFLDSELPKLHSCSFRNPNQKA
jgi:hypothetical protein